MQTAATPDALAMWRDVIVQIREHAASTPYYDETPGHTGSSPAHWRIWTEGPSAAPCRIRLDVRATGQRAWACPTIALGSCLGPEESLQAGFRRLADQALDEWSANDEWALELPQEVEDMLARVTS